MQSMPRQTVFAAGGILILAAVLGLYFGISRSLTPVNGASDESAPIVPAVTAVSSAKPILAPIMDEAEVRRLAREEAQALMAKSAPKKAAADDDDADTTPSEDLTPVTPAMPPAPSKPATSPQG